MVLVFYGYLDSSCELKLPISQEILQKISSRKYSRNKVQASLKSKIETVQKNSHSSSQKHPKCCAVYQSLHKYQRFKRIPISIYLKRECERNCPAKLLFVQHVLKVFFQIIFFF